MKMLIGAAVAASLPILLTGCGDDGGDTATDPARTESAATTDPTATPTVGSYPEFAPQDYSFVLEQICFCPVTGPVDVVVEQGVVTSAVIAKGGRGLPKGSEAPGYLRLTLNDVIAAANDTEADKVEVSWPEGQDWPDRVRVDRDELAMDDELTYVVRKVRVS